ncbi:P-type conjugative transfer ATPase TrbB [Pandoraea cepalis]|uniref:P-type conjugative transfer ATPase TrbB n=1 Tax=Pandoraea cepalis TaxID=2508294 RepID=A0AAW7MHB1_9BURK|nr:P-type conjugative transfer ATPase TrbB [Pandoraea cepalis]MDN4572051.1 P-type conjugative transfer ATPase TrbB [Pandoraea cepalis]MDN4578897.1 P-type conjugative transfer ATPase TrbB [Pandoraea cepalis]
MRSEDEMRRLMAALSRQFGDPLIAAMSDPLTNDIQLNADGVWWWERFGRGREQGGVLAKSAAETLMGSIAHYLGQTVGYDHPVLEGRLPFNDCRFAGVMPPIVTAPAFSIRRPGVIFTLFQYVKTGSIAAKDARRLRSAYLAGKNILIIGGTGAGKTMLLNAMLALLATYKPETRVLIAEDTPEVQCKLPNHVSMVTKVSEPAVNLAALIKLALRFKPDRIIVGEVRDGTAADMLEAWNTGHLGGLGTIHANDCRSAVQRLADMLRKANIPQEVALRQIATSVDIMVSIQRMPDGKRKINEIVQLDGINEGEIQFKPF